MPDSQMRDRRPILSLVVPTLILAISTFATGQDRRVDTAVALSHVIKKVDAAVPDEAKAKKIGGPVIADVTIDAKGTVSSLVILSGPELLRPEAERALRQWVFKPFAVDGTPASVRAILEIDFPDPIKEEEHRHFEDYRAATYECERQLEVNASNAEAACAAAIQAVQQLPTDRVLERSHALVDHGHALMASGRTVDAISELEHADQVRRRVSPGPDADSADLRQILAMLHQQLGENQEADAQFAAAISEYTAAIQQLPGMRQIYEPRLRSALTRYAQLKWSTGDAAAAAALQARAAEISELPTAPPVVAVTRSVDGIEVNEPVDGRLSDDDLGRVRAAIVATGKRPWRLKVLAVSRGIGTNADGSSEVYAFFTPEVVSPTFRRGLSALVVRLPVSPAKNAPLAWTILKGRFVYVQVATGANDAASESPIPVMEADEPSGLKDADLISIVRLVRERAVPNATDRYVRTSNRGRFATFGSSTTKST